MIHNKVALKDALRLEIAALQERIQELEQQNAALWDACDDALNTFIGCVVPGPGCDDKAALLQTQTHLRAALKLGPVKRSQDVQKLVLAARDSHTYLLREIRHTNDAAYVRAEALAEALKPFEQEKI